jgi:preprotein translocase subunit YajC
MTTTQTYLFLLVGLAVLFYMLVLRPQRRVKAQREQLLASLRPGADVITAGGIHGTIVSLDDGELDLEVADGVVLRVDPRAIAEVLADEDEDDEDGYDDEDEAYDEDDDGEVGSDGTEADADYVVDADEERSL